MSDDIRFSTVDEIRTFIGYAEMNSEEIEQLPEGSARALYCRVYEVMTARHQAFLDRVSVCNDGCTPDRQAPDMEEALLLSRFYLGPHGSVDLVNPDLVGSEERAKTPLVTKVEYWHELIDRIRADREIDELERFLLHRSVGAPHIPIPPPDTQCARCCGTFWHPFESHQIRSRGFLTMEPIGEHDGKTYAQVRDWFRARRDGVWSINHLVVQNDAWIDLNPPPRASVCVAEAMACGLREEGDPSSALSWRPISWDNPISSGDRMQVRRDDFFHGDCWQMQMRDERVSSEREREAHVEQFFRDELGLADARATTTTLPTDLHNLLVSHVFDGEEFDELAGPRPYVHVETRLGSIAFVFADEMTLYIHVPASGLSPDSLNTAVEQLPGGLVRVLSMTNVLGEVLDLLHHQHHQASS